MSETFKLMAWHVKDFKTIQVMNVEPNGKHVEIKGPNASGKTSHLDTIFFALQGLRKGQPNPVRFGANEALVEITIDNGMEGEDLTIRRTIDADGKMKLEIDRAGETIKSAKQGVIDLLLTKYMLNPVDFLSLRPQDQKDALLALCDAPCPVDKVEDITGIRIAPKEGEAAYRYLTRLSGDKEGFYYEARKCAGHDADVAAKALEEARGAKGRMTPVEDPGDPLLWDAKIGQLERDNADFTEKRITWNSANARLGSAAAAAECATNRIRDTTTRVECVRLEYEQAKLACCNANIENETAHANLVTAKQEHDQAHRAVCAAKDCSAAILEARAGRAKAFEQTTQYAAWKAACDRVTFLAVKQKEASVKYDKASETLNKLRQLRRDIVNGIDIGVSGLECDGESLTIEGAPLLAASMAQQLRLACAIAIKQNPKLRLLRVDEGERLDHRSRMKLYDIADQNGCQVILTSVSDQKYLTISLVE